MIQDVWVHGAVLSLAFAQLFVFWFLYRRSSASSAADRVEVAGEGGRDGEPDEGTVVCPDCGAENDAGFRYCRQCADELPGELGAAIEGGNPRSRGMF